MAIMYQKKASISFHLKQKTRITHTEMLKHRI